MADEFGISVRSYHAFLTEKLNMLRVAVNFVSLLLTDDPKEQRVAIVEELLHLANDEENFSQNFVTGDQTWVYRYDVET
jgi:hypothetical protein